MRIRSIFVCGLRYCVLRIAEPPIRSFSESSELSDTADSQNVSESAECGLEAVEGVQPELQKTPRESEIESKFRQN